MDVSDARGSPLSGTASVPVKLGGGSREWKGVKSERKGSGWDRWTCQNGGVKAGRSKASVGTEGGGQGCRQMNKEEVVGGNVLRKTRWGPERMQRVGGGHGRQGHGLKEVGQRGSEIVRALIGNSLLAPTHLPGVI